MKAAMVENELYKPQNDWDFNKGYIDVDVWRNEPLRHHYIHGGIEGSTLKFSFYFPEKADYEGRFFHFVAPVQGTENASQTIHKEDDKISFAITHGAYFVESNMGGSQAEGTQLYKCSAAAAQYSRIIAVRLYGEHRPYGYVYGGSGGSLKTFGCIENTDEVWDGAVPFVIGTPMSIPNNFTVRAHAMRILRNKIPMIVDAMEPGGSGDIYKGLNEEERAALEEATKMGFPIRTWFSHYFIGDGALGLLTPGVEAIDPTYYKDFWNVPGYLGAEPDSSACRDRIQFQTKLSKIYIPEVRDKEEHTNSGVDEAWHIFQNLDQFEENPSLELEHVPKGNLYLHGTNINILDGEAAGVTLPFDHLNGKSAVIGEYFQTGLRDLLKKLKPGDTIELNNSNYIALQTYHRHQVPSKDYFIWDQFRDEEGTPLYPQRPVLVGPIIAANGGGVGQSGKFKGKMIILDSLMDESAFPCQAHWYRKLVEENLGEEAEDAFRLWYIDHAMHAETEGTEAKLHVVKYLGALNQALLDLSAWVEKGIKPPKSTSYIIKGGQVLIPDRADERRGVQPVVKLLANGGDCINVKCGEQIMFQGSITVPNDMGKVTMAEWDFCGEGVFEMKGKLVYQNEKGSRAKTSLIYCFEKPGTYFPVLKAASSRSEEDRFTQIYNLKRVKVIVE